MSNLATIFAKTKEKMKRKSIIRFEILAVNQTLNYYVCVCVCIYISRKRKKKQQRKSLLQFFRSILLNISNRKEHKNGKQLN